MSNGETYTTESKDEITRMTKAGEVEISFRIYATSKGGTRFHVEIGEDQLDQAPAILAARAKELDSI